MQNWFKLGENPTGQLLAYCYANRRIKSTTHFSTLYRSDSPKGCFFWPSGHLARSGECSDQRGWTGVASDI